MFQASTTLYRLRTLLYVIILITGGGAELRGGAEEAGEVHQQPQEDVHTLPRHHHRQTENQSRQFSFVLNCLFLSSYVHISVADL
jgi:hypothetical protein